MRKTINLKDATIKEIIAYSLLPFGIYTFQSIITTSFNFYLTDVLKLTPLLVGLVLFGTKFWDAVNDPMMGAIIERTRTKHGKCRPYLRWMTLPLILCTFLLYLPIAEIPYFQTGIATVGGTPGEYRRFIYIFIMYMLFYAAYTGVEIPFNGLAPLIFPENEKRVKAISWSNIVGSLGTVLPSVAFFVFVDIWKDHKSYGSFLGAAIFALVGGVFIYRSFFGIKEKIYLPPKKAEFKKCLKIAFGEKKMVLLLFAAFFMGMINVGSILLPHFVQWNCIGVIDFSKLGFLSGMTNLSLLSPVVQVFSGLAYMTSMAIVPPLLKRFSKRKLWIWVSLIGAAANFIVFIVGIYIIPYNTLAGLIVYIVLRFFAHFPIGICLVLLMSMFADFIDELEMKTGERLEGTLSSFKGLLYGFSFAAFNLIIMLALEAANYDVPTMEAYAVVDNVYVNPLIQSTTNSAINDIVVVVDGIGKTMNYTKLLNLIFFILTAFVGFSLILQAIPMFFVKDNEADIEEQVLAFRAEKEKKYQEELDLALAHHMLDSETVAEDTQSA